ncbi:hypothetical protein Dsin_018501 [Dipteronia sinensis]|uniref:Uncharacterized protein n=1 Tax=Dipteronia sinensis TaxID=43782 RepID=A0AAE0A5P1_9ROSI|nr:hypothetical protein Dsin_018501 [Dipteronia sinensis]
MDEVLPLRNSKTASCRRQHAVRIEKTRRLDDGVQVDDVGCRRRWLDIVYDVDIVTKKLRLGRNGCRRRWLASTMDDGFDRDGRPEELGI